MFNKVTGIALFSEGHEENGNYAVTEENPEFQPEPLTV